MNNEQKALDAINSAMAKTINPNGGPKSTDDYCDRQFCCFMALSDNIITIREALSDDQTRHKVPEALEELEIIENFVMESIDHTDCKRSYEMAFEEIRKALPQPTEDKG